MKRTMKNILTMGAVFVVTVFGLPVLPASAMATGHADTCPMNAELWDGSSGYIETDFASVTGSVDGLQPVSVAGLWDGSEGTSEPMIFASQTGSFEGLSPTPVAGLWDGSEGTSEPTEFASASAQHDGAASSPVVALELHETPCGMTN